MTAAETSSSSPDLKKLIFPMKLLRHISALSLFSLLSALPVLTSCTESEMMNVTDEISFVASLPGASSRSYNLVTCLRDSGFTVSAFCPEDKADANGILDVHCQDVNVTLQVDGVFRSDSCKWPGNPGDKTGQLKFFAFHPSRADMKKRAAVGTECFIYANHTKKTGEDIAYDYWLTKFRVAPDISEQVDFITAIGEGNKTTDLYSVVELAFEHQLSGVEVGVWGDASLYDIEVAGVRVGGIVIEADFNLSAEHPNLGQEENSIGEWYIPEKPLKGYVDYVFAPGDKVVRINTNEHNTKETAASIMGGSGKALLIPQKQDMWDYKNDRTSPPKGMYFSALVHVTQHGGDHHRIFPSTDPQSQDYIVYLSVRKSDGTVMKRLDKYGNAYGTTTKYEIPDTEELRHYGWAAAPAKVDWKPGYTYCYLLDYTKGVGVHDPYDPNPAAPVVDWGGVEVITTTGNWSSGGVIGNGGWGANSNNTAPDGTIWWK